jgi:hypothetical protein
MSWYDFDENQIVECRCGWRGPVSAGGIEIYSQCFAFECPQCGKTLAVFSPPTIDETKKKAAEGNKKAQGDLASALRRESFMQRATASELESADQLPDLEGDEIVIEWDFEDRKDPNGDNWTVLRHEGREIWREIAYYEGLDRYSDVATILIEKYGDRLVGFPATKASRLYLYGDDIRNDPVTPINERLARTRKNR